MTRMILVICFIVALTRVGVRLLTDIRELMHGCISFFFFVSLTHAYSLSLSLIDCRTLTPEAEEGGRGGE